MGTESTFQDVFEETGPTAAKACAIINLLVWHKLFLFYIITSYHHIAFWLLYAQSAVLSFLLMWLFAIKCNIFWKQNKTLIYKGLDLEMTCAGGNALIIGHIHWILLIAPPYETLNLAQYHRAYLSPRGPFHRKAGVVAIGTHPEKLHWTHKSSAIFSGSAHK